MGACGSATCGLAPGTGALLLAGLLALDSKCNGRCTVVRSPVPGILKPCLIVGGQRGQRQSVSCQAPALVATTPAAALWPERSGCSPLVPGCSPAGEQSA